METGVTSIAAKAHQQSAVTYEKAHQQIHFKPESNILVAGKANRIYNHLTNSKKATMCRRNLELDGEM